MNNSKRYTSKTKIVEEVLALSNISKFLDSFKSIDLSNETVTPSVRFSILNNNSKGFKLQFVIELHDVLDNSYLHRKTVSISETNRDRAVIIASGLQDEIIEILNKAIQKSHQHNLVEFCESYVETLQKEKRVSSVTVDNYIEKIKLIRVYFDDDDTIETCTTETISNFCTWAFNNGRVKPLVNPETGLKSDKTLSARTVQDYHGFLFGVFKFAINKGIIQSNPCQHTILPKRKESNVKDVTALWMDIETYNQFRAWLIDSEQIFSKLVDLVDITILTGCRREEVLGLRWRDVDLDNKTLTIQHTRVRTARAVYELDDVKTRASNRVYRLNKNLLETFSKIKQQSIDLGLYDLDSYVFVWSDVNSKSYGLPYDPDYISKLFSKAVKRCPHTNSALTFHKLRHSCCSILRGLGWSKEDAKAWLGHESSSITEEVYNHYEQSVDIDKFDLLDKIIKA